jgi:hypothetical protein
MPYIYRADTESFFIKGYVKCNDEAWHDWWSLHHCFVLFFICNSIEGEARECGGRDSRIEASGMASFSISTFCD